MSTFHFKMLPLTIFMSLFLAGSAVGDQVAYYRMDEGFGTIAYDSSGHGNHGTIVNAAWAFGSYGTALYFDGYTDSFVNCGQDASLDISESGSILVWFKPEAFPQGGIVCWGPGGSWPEQRFVTILNDYGNYEELGVYLADGVDFFRPYRGPFPPMDEWSHLAVTFTQRSIDIYVDGELVATGFQKLKPDLAGYDMLIGKTNGWVPVGHFKGWIDEVQVHDDCLTAREIFEFYRAEAANRGKDTSGFDTIRIEPAANSKAGTVTAGLDYRGLALSAQDLIIEVDLRRAKRRNASGGPDRGASRPPQGQRAPAGTFGLDPSEPPVIPAQVRMTPVWGDATAVVPVADLPAGTYAIRARAFDGGGVQVGITAMQNVYWPGRDPGWENVTVLNNLCWELLDESPGPPPFPSIQFFNPRGGWVYFITEVTGDLTISMTGATPPLIHDPAGSARQEAMRWLPAGHHGIFVTGTGSLDRIIARSIPTVLFAHYPDIKIGLNTTSNHSFLEEHVLTQANAILSGGSHWYTDTWVNENGGRWYSVVYKPLADGGGTAREIQNYLTATQGMTHPDLHGILVDEFYPGVPYVAEWTEACANIIGDPQFAGHRIIPYCGGNMWNDPECAAFLQTVVGVGQFADPDARIAWMSYFPELETEDRAWYSVKRRLTEVLDGLEQIIPDPAEHLLVALSYLKEFAGEDAEPQVDFKTFMDMQFLLLATEPEFFGIPGIEEYVSHHSDEESIRWAARLFRHFVLEGRSDRYSPDPYDLGHILNGDFLDGTDGWTIVEAEAGSVDVRRYKGYGILQHRRSHGYGTSLPFLRTRRSALKPNTFSQTINGLEAGRLYSLKFITGDYQDLINGITEEENHALSIDIQGAEVLSGTEYGFQHAGKSSGEIGSFNADNPFWMNLNWQVFRALGTTATLTVSDWPSPVNPGGPIGQELIYNHIEIQPYHEAAP